MRPATEQAFSGCQSVKRRSVKPSELSGIDSAPSVEGEDRGAEVDAMDFRLLEFRTAVLIAFRPEADAVTRSSSSCAAGTLRAAARLMRPSSQRSTPRCAS